MTLRRRTPLKPSRGTTWPTSESNAIYARDRGMCVGPVAGLVGDCYGIPHTDAWKTVHGREARPLLLAYLERHYGRDAA